MVPKGGPEEREGEARGLVRYPREDLDRSPPRGNGGGIEGGAPHAAVRSDFPAEIPSFSWSKNGEQAIITSKKNRVDRLLGAGQDHARTQGDLRSRQSRHRQAPVDDRQGSEHRSFPENPPAPVGYL